MSISGVTSKNFGNLCFRGWTHHCGPGKKKIGIMVVAIGVIWLGARLGLVDISWMRWIYFWPMVLIVFGFWLIYKGSNRRMQITKDNEVKEV